MRHRKRGRSKENGVSGIDSDGDGDHTLAHIAAASGDVALLVKAVQQDPGVIQQRDGEGHTPLAHAVHGRHLHAVKRLVKMGAEVNAQDSQGRTYLSVAAYQGWNEGVVYLLRKGAKQNIEDKSGRTPLHASTYDTDTKSLLTLMKRLSSDELNASDSEKMTALHWSAFHDRPEHIRLLLSRGANYMLLDVDGKTPLHWAAQNGSRNCCLLLAQHGNGSGLLTCEDNSGKTAMHLAAAAGKAFVIQDLAHFAPDLCEMDDHDDRTPLHWSAAMGHIDCLKTLLQLGVSPNPLDVDGISPLEYAKRASHKQCLALLEETMSLKSTNKTDTDCTKSGQSTRATVGFFKGLFSKKQKQIMNCEKHSDNHLPKVIVAGDRGKVSRTSSQGPNNHTNLDRDGEETGRLGNTKHSQINNDFHSNGAVSYEDSLSAFGDDEDQMTYLEKVSHHRKKRKKHKRRNDKDDASSPVTSKTLSSWNDDAAMNANSSSRATNPRSMHLSPLGNTRPPSISPRVSHNFDSPILSNRDVLSLRRQGELSPIRTSRLPNMQHDVPLHNNLVNLKINGERSRSPTPPPCFAMNINTKKALPGISPLTQSMESLELEKKKKHKTTNNVLDNHLGTSSPYLSNASFPDTPE